MKKIKTLMLLMACFIISGKGFSQITLPVQENQCVFTSPVYTNGYVTDSIRILTAPANGNSVSLDSSYYYCPQSGFTGLDSMTVSSCSTTNGVTYTCDTFEVYLNVQQVNQPIVFTENCRENHCDTFNSNPNTGHIFSFNAYWLFAGPANGQLFVDTPGAYMVYCPDSGFTGIDSMSIWLQQSGNGISSYGSDTFKVYFNVQPAFRPGSFYTVMNENQCFLFADPGPNGTYNIDSIQIISQATHGTAVSSDSFFRYCPNTGYVGSDTFMIYACSYANGVFSDCGVDTFYYTMLRVSQYPSFTENFQENQCDTFTYDPNTGYSFQNIQLLTPPLHGTAPNLTFLNYLEYCPDSGFTGLDSMSFYACQYNNGLLYGCDTFEVYLNVHWLTPYPSFTVEFQENRCDTFAYDPNTTLTLDSIQILRNPANGNASSVASNYILYCPDTGFTGLDSVLIYACQHENGVSYGCDTFEVYLNVQPQCNMSVTLAIDTGGCPGGNLLTAAVTGGTAPYTYLWNDNSVDLTDCQIYAVQYCVSVTDANNCTASSCTGNSSPVNSFTEQFNENQCDTFSYDSRTAHYINIDSVQILTYPANGNIYIYTGMGYLQYCPHNGFVGLDSMLIYACEYANGLSYGCDTIEVYLNVQSGCNISVSLVTDTATCPGGGQHYFASIGGTPASPLTYLWSDTSTGSGDCQAHPGQNLCVTVTDANGCTAVGCTGVACSVAVSITLDSTLCNGLPGLAVNTSGTAPYSYYWSPIGDTTSTICGTNGGQLPGGSYCVEVTDAYGCSGSYCYNLAGPGNCSFQYLQPNANSQAIDFYGSYDTAYTLASVSWNFGDGGSGNVINPVHSYVSYGSYYVTMTLYYTGGDSCSSTQYIYVSNDSANIYPYCQAYFSSYISSGDTVVFTDQSVYSPITWLWNFGDGNTSALQNPSHVYSSSGTWNVCLTITDTSLGGSANPCTSSYCQQVSNVSVQDMEAYLFHGSTVTPGYPLYVYLEYYNNGTILMNGTVVYKYPAGTTVSYAYPTPVSTDTANRLLTFSYDSLLPGASNFIGVSLAADSNLMLGSLVYDTEWVYPMVGDVNPANNISTIIDSVVGSWDPNGKSVSPKGRGEKGLIEASTPVVSYMIHFQNTGNAPARQVIVRDTISDNVDMATVRVTYASFKCVPQIIGNVLVVSFDNINLPDTATSLLASQGAFSVIANLKPGLPGGSQIFNTANIYFDANAQVITNTVLNTLPSVAGIANIGDLEFTLMPNPANNRVLIKGNFENVSTWELDDLLGRQLLQGKMTSAGAELSVAEMSAGVYLVKVMSGDRTGAQRLVVVR